MELDSRVSTMLCMLLCRSGTLHSQVMFAIKRALAGTVYYALGAVTIFAQAIKLMSKPTELLQQPVSFKLNFSGLSKLFLCKLSKSKTRLNAHLEKSSQSIHSSVHYST